MSQTLRFFPLLVLTILASNSVADDEADSEALRIEIEHLVETGFLSTGEAEIASSNLLVEIYEKRNFALAWNDVEQIAELIEAIKATDADGLNPSDYHLDEVETAYNELTGGATDSPAHRAAQDLILTDSLARLGYHQLFGKVNPYTLDPHWNFRRELNDMDPATAIQEGIDSPSLLEYLKTVFPRGWVYRQYKVGLAAYRQIQADGGWPQIPEGPTIRPGASDGRLSVLAQRLAISGDLDEDQLSILVTNYGDVLQEGVKRFQHRHGLDVDAIVGRGTLRALNVPVEDRVRQLEINLERTRWVTDDIEDDFVLVNIASFRAFVIRDREIVWETKVQVGRTYHQSPVFRDLMKYVVINPTWTVPYSIATKEMLPQIQSDPDYFAKRDFDIKDRSGNLVDAASIDWSKLTRRNFGYTLVQRPGPNNALGRVKFMFPNAHAVYLHDTPSKYLFSRADRAFSHGCIRVENPFDFAEVLLGSAGWNQDRFQEVLDSRETKTVFLPNPIPVLLLYWTAHVDPDGVVFFYDDVYERDQAIAEALGEPFRLDIP